MVLRCTYRAATLFAFTLVCSCCRRVLRIRVSSFALFSLIFCLVVTSSTFCIMLTILSNICILSSIMSQGSNCLGSFSTTFTFCPISTRNFYSTCSSLSSFLGTSSLFSCYPSSFRVIRAGMFIRSRRIPSNRIPRRQRDGRKAQHHDQGHEQRQEFS